jgi:hypothetical protein
MDNIIEILEGISWQKGESMDTDYLGEAAEALEAPGEIWLFRNRIYYDRDSREWRCSGSDCQGLKFAGEVRDWLLRICDWLQCNYPEGPVYST